MLAGLQAPRLGTLDESPDQLDEGSSGGTLARLGLKVKKLMPFGDEDSSGDRGPKSGGLMLSKG